MSERSDGNGAEPHDSMIDVINVYKKHVNRAVLRENLKLTVEQRLLKAQAIHEQTNSWQKTIAEIHALLEEGDKMSRSN